MGLDDSEVVVDAVVDVDILRVVVGILADVVDRIDEDVVLTVLLLVGQA